MKKQLNALFAVILACAFITSCSSSDNDDNNGSLILSTPEISFTAGNLTDKFAVQTEDKWSIGDLPTWVSASPMNGTGDAEVTLTLLPNAAVGGEDRNIQIVIKTANAEKKLTVKQALSKKYLSKITRKVGNTGKPSSVSFTYNEDNTLLKYSTIDEAGKTTDIAAFEYDVDKRLAKATQYKYNYVFSYKYINNGTVERTLTDDEIPAGKDITIYTISSNGYPTKSVREGFYFKPEVGVGTTYPTVKYDYVYNSDNTFKSYKQTVVNPEPVASTRISDWTYEYDTADGVHPLCNLSTINFYLLNTQLPDDHLMLTNIGAFAGNNTKCTYTYDEHIDTQYSTVYTYGEDKFPKSAIMDINVRGTKTKYNIEFEYIVK